MDWARAIERNSEALKGIVAALFTMLGGVGERMPRPLHRAVLKVLGPAESAVRRLIVIAARGLVLKPIPTRVMTRRPVAEAGKKRLAFRLFDRRKSFATQHNGRRLEPRIHFFGGAPFNPLFRQPPQSAAGPTAPVDDGFVDARRLRLRLEAVANALGDLPRQARRLARWRARREQAAGLKHVSPLRPGHPPGRRKKPIHAVDTVLAECHALAWDAMAPDTS